MATTTTGPSGSAETNVNSGGPRRLSPRKRRRITLGIQYVIFVAVIVIIAVSINWGDIQEHFFDPDGAKETLPEMFTIALKNTIIYALTGYAFGFALGMILALMRLSSVAPYRWVALVYIEIFRGLPLLLVLLLIAFGLPVAFPGLEFPFGHYGQGAVGLGLVAAAYLAETLRAGIQAIPRGQMEAARSLGMSRSRAMISIVIPQAVRVVIPPLTNELIVLFKDSSLVSTIGVVAEEVEVTKLGSDVAIRTADSTPFIVAGAAYLLITVPLGILVRRLEARQAKGR
jgi:polar amino acid transport system permease protein